MPCPDFEELMRQGLSGHAAYCEDCRALVEAAADVDGMLESAFADLSAPPGMAGVVRERIAREIPIRRPTILPEALDFIAWAALLALAAVLLPRLLLRLAMAG